MLYEVHRGSKPAQPPKVPLAVLIARVECASQMRFSMKHLAMEGLVKRVDGGFVSRRGYYMQDDLSVDQEVATWLALEKKTGRLSLYTQAIEWHGPNLDTEMGLDQSNERAYVNNAPLSGANIVDLDPNWSESRQLEAVKAAQRNVAFLAQIHHFALPDHAN